MQDDEETQRMINIIFEIARTSARQFGLVRMRQQTYRKTKEKAHMKWVAKVLRDNGYDTVPKGNLFGVLKEKE